MTNAKSKDLPLLCGHDEPFIYSRKKVKCPVCKSFWDLDSLRAEPVYDGSYPELRLHFDREVGSLKIKTLQMWLRKAGIEQESLNSVNVCEVGFGGAYCLSYLKAFAKEAYGIEVIPENIEHAVRLGIKRECLYHAEHLPPLLPEKIGLWIFQDSFEHIPEPSDFIKWAVQNSSANSRILLVMPRAGSLSERILGRWWPHKLPDHQFHWSKKGIVDFFLRHGFGVEKQFCPLKYISVKIAAAHVMMKASLLNRFRHYLNRLPAFAFRFNIGEMGFLFKRL